MNNFTATSCQKRESIRHAFFESHLGGVGVFLAIVIAILVLPHQVSAQKTFIFTNFGATGRLVPTQTQVDAVYF
ncbi:hypothetical protein GCM10028895_25540 [Pontibacter rugosus]